MPTAITPRRAGRTGRREREVEVTRVDLFTALIADARSPRTARARRQDIDDLGRFLGIADPKEATLAVVAGGQGNSNALALGYREAMQGRKLAASTINRRLSTLRRVAKIARRFEMMSWTIEVEGLKTAAYRDTAGPGKEGMRRVIERAKADARSGKPKDRRDWALVALLYSGGLRRAEAAGLDVADFDQAGRRVRVVGKGSSEARWMPTGGPAAAAIAGWIERHPRGEGPLFVRLDRAARGGERLSADGIHDIIAALGRKATLSRPLAPHQIRHASITRLAERTGGNLPLIREFSRHSRVETVGVYVRNAANAAAKLSELLGEDLDDAGEVLDGGTIVPAEPVAPCNGFAPDGAIGSKAQGPDNSHCREHAKRAR